MGKLTRRSRTTLSRSGIWRDSQDLIAWIREHWLAAWTIVAVLGAMAAWAVPSLWATAPWPGKLALVLVLTLLAGWIVAASVASHQNTRAWWAQHSKTLAVRVDRILASGCEAEGITGATIFLTNDNGRIDGLRMSLSAGAVSSPSVEMTGVLDNVRPHSQERVVADFEGTTVSADGLSVWGTLEFDDVARPYCFRYQNGVFVLCDDSTARRLSRRSRASSRSLKKPV